MDDLIDKLMSDGIDEEELEKLTAEVMMKLDVVEFTGKNVIEVSEATGRPVIVYTGDEEGIAALTILPGEYNGSIDLDPGDFLLRRPDGNVIGMDGDEFRSLLKTTGFTMTDIGLVH